MPRNHHDALFKAVFSQPEQAAAHLRAVLPSEVTRHLDFDHLRHAPGSFVDEELSDRHTDLLFEVESRWGDESAFVYLLFEHQSSPDPLMPFRLLGYLVRIWQHWLGQYPRARALPIVVPVVLYHGGERWNVPSDFASLIDAPDEVRHDLASWMVDFRYLLEDLRGVEDDELRGRALGRMALLLMKHASDGRLWERLPTWITVLQAVLSESGLRAIEIVMRYVIDVEKEPPTEELQRLLVDQVGRETVEAIMSWAQKLREEGMRAGEDVGARRLLHRLIEKRFRAVPESVSEAIEAAHLEQLEAWTDRLFTAKSAEDVVRE
ncbi:MAG: Rpn family recombination-promoting nuclease/putative transposase [Myxococcota bacterium]